VGNLFVEAVEEGHAEGGVEDEDDGVEEDLVTDRDIPVRDEVGILAHAFGVGLDALV
jgi:hypothetical protein